MSAELYHNRVLELAANIPNVGTLEDADASVEKVSRVCGSVVRVDIRLSEDGETVEAIAVDPKACALGQAATSVLAENIVGAPVDEVLAARDALRAMLKEGGPIPAAPFDGFEVLEPAREYKNRHASILLALEAMHELSVVYRDLKPENVLMERDGYLKITDFGLSKQDDALSTVDGTGTLCGTAAYMAPELIESAEHGLGVDWWALGVLVFEMLAGYPPFYDENPFGIYQKILGGKIEFPRHFDTKAKDLIKKLLTADRTKRIGCLKRGAEDIKNHKWFSKLDWTAVYNEQVPAPFIPEVHGDGDTPG